MKQKYIISRALDLLMTLALLSLMGYHLFGEAAHEYIGAGMFVMFILHNIINLNWYKSLFKGHYPPFRILQIVINILVLISMLAQMYSGIMLSQHVFTFLPIKDGLALARRLHILGSHWGFLLMSCHLGLHWGLVLGIIKKHILAKNSLKISFKLLNVIGVLIAAYGVGVFIERDFITYMLLKSEFVFLNYGESIIKFYFDYLSLMSACILIAHYLSKWLRSIKVKRGS